MAPHPFSGSEFRLLWQKALTHQISPRYYPRLLSALTISSIGRWGRAKTKQQFKQRIESYQFEAEPVFILGHWRSGTTYLHHLMSQDHRFSYVSTYQAFVPEEFLSNSWITRAAIGKSLPQKRPMDNVKLSLQKPEEEELAMGNVSPLSYVDTFAFPREARDIFNRTVLFEGSTPEERQRWGEDYVRLLKMACIGMSKPSQSQLHARPLLKSPGNTARIPTLLKLFPNAKFIHIYRNPYTIFPSKVLTCRKLIEVWKFQDIDSAELEENVLYIYEQTMQRYFRDRTLIPPQNLIEIRYEDFEQDQLNTLRAIYQQLDISEFEQWKPRFEAYISSRSSYKKNEHQLDEATLTRVGDRWGFAIQALGYHPPVLAAAS